MDKSDRTVLESFLYRHGLGIGNESCPATERSVLADVLAVVVKMLLSGVAWGPSGTLDRAIQDSVDFIRQNQPASDQVSQSPVAPA